jgi:hypothetical protein
MFLRNLKNAQRFFSDTQNNEPWMNPRPEPISRNIFPNLSLYAENYNIDEIEDISLPDSDLTAPTLKHKLDSIIRTEGIYMSSQFPKVVQEVPPINSEISKRLNTYIEASKDQTLIKRSKEVSAKYFSGSSSLTDAFQKIFYSITNFKSPDVTGFSKSFNNTQEGYMSAYRKPSIFFLKKHEKNLYSIDSDKGPVNTKNIDILLKGGIIMEGLFTTEAEDFARIIDLNIPLSEEDQKAIFLGSKTYRYRKIGKLVIRSQIDCQAKDELGNPFVYEIKTRACYPIRYDIENYEKYLDYKIVKRNGLADSYEIEYYDLIRSILLKYFFQIKLGRMDGAFLAYHNTAKFFGFEYIRIGEIEKRLFGCPEISNQVLKICAIIFQDILDDVVNDFPDHELIKVGIFSDFMSKEIMIFVEPHRHAFEYPTDPRILEKIEHEIDYYQMFFPNTSPYVYCRKIFPIINGISQNEPVFLEPGDQYSFKQIKYFKGMMEFSNYMNFLLNAYKLDSSINDIRFSGFWKKDNDFHVYRKPIYKTYY